MSAQTPDGGSRTDALDQKGRPKGRQTALYDYHNAAGDLVHQTVRFAPKDFRQRRPDPVRKGAFLWNLDGIEPVIYRLPELLNSPPGEPVWICEGEKDCDLLHAHGLVSTTNPMGAGKWKDSYSQWLKKRHVVILPDNDTDGDKHAVQVATSLREVAATVRVVKLEPLPPKGDVSNWIAEGGRTAKELREAAAATLVWEPPIQVKRKTSWEGRDLLTTDFPDIPWAVDGPIHEGERNSTLTTWGGKLRRQGLSAAEIKATLLAMNADRCDPPLDPKEVAKIAKSVGRYEPAVKLAAGPPEKELMPGPYALTDVGNSERFAAEHKGKLLACNGEWLTWDGGRWDATRGEGVAVELAVETVKRLYVDAGNAATQEESTALAKHAIRSQAQSRIDAMLSLARRRPEPFFTLQSEFDCDPWLLNVKNGVVDLRTGRPLAHDPGYLMTRQANANYNPGATAPRWADFLAETFGGDPDVLGYIQRLAGYCLTGDTREQAWFLFYGLAQSGKSTLVATLAHVMGSYARSMEITSFLDFPGRPPIPDDLAQLPGVRFAYSGEPGKGATLSERTLKALTGDKIISTRRLYHSTFEYEPVAKIVLASNWPLKAEFDDQATWRRLHVVQFERMVPDEHLDLTLGGKLAKEADGILAWAVEGCLQWQQRQGLDVPARVAKAGETYRRSMSLCQTFLSEHCEFAPDKRVAMGELYHAFETWCEERGRKPTPRKNLTDALDKMLVQKRKAKYQGEHVWVYQGVSLTVES